MMDPIPIPIPMYPQPDDRYTVTVTYLPPLPQPSLETNGDVFGHENVEGFTADQMKDYATQAVLLERERCAKVCDAIYAEEQQEPECYGFAAECAAAIRNP